MSNIQKIDKYSLKEHYYTGFKKVIKVLESDLFPSEFRAEVENDLLELFIRNQEMGKDFDEVIGGDINTFISEIVDAYISNLPKKYMYFNILKMGLIISSIMSIFTLIEHGSNVASLFMLGFSFIVGIFLYLILYKTCGKYNSRISIYLSSITGFSFVIFEKFCFEYISLFNTLSSYSINPIIFLLLLALELCTIILLKGSLKKIN